MNRIGGGEDDGSILEPLEEVVIEPMAPKPRPIEDNEEGLNNSLMRVQC